VSYIHGTERSEQQRLEVLNRLTNAAFVQFLDVHANMRVLEVGSGLGLLAVDVAGSASNVRVIGVEQSREQIAAASRDSAVSYTQGDAHRLQFEDDSFDLVYTRYLLEHVADPERVVAEMRRVARPRCRVAACENDISLLRMDPACPAFTRVWNTFQHYQQHLGGDSNIGRRLYRLFRHAGLVSIELSVQPEIHWHGSPGFAAWIRNLIGNIESARLGLMNSGLCGKADIDSAIADMTALLSNEDASCQFVWNRAVGVKP
jgi:SAM-dependent methyltransferase